MPRFRPIECAAVAALSLGLGCSNAPAARTPPPAEHAALADLVAHSVAPASGRLRDCYLHSRQGGKTVSVRVDYKLSTLGHAVHLNVDSNPSSPELEKCERDVMEGIVQLTGTVGIDVRMLEEHTPSADSAPSFVVFVDPPPAADPNRETGLRPGFFLYP